MRRLSLSDPGTITRAANAIAAGDVPTTSDPGVVAIYEQLRILAAARLRKDGAAALSPTELVHEVVLKLFRPGQKPWDSRAHFFGSAARAVQQLLIDDARRRQRAPQLLPELDGIAGRARDPIALTGAIEALQAHDPQLAEIVRLRIFAGMTAAQTCDLLGIAPRTLVRHWSFACAWLMRRLKDEAGES